MKAVNHGCGLRGWLMVVVAALTVVAGALFLGGCGDDDQQAVADVPEDSKTVSVKSEDIRDVTEVGSGEEDILPGYSAGTCLEEMTARYGSADTAAQVCNTIRTDNGSATVAQLPQIVPQIEQELGVTPLPGSPPPGSGTDPVTTTTTTPDPVVEQPGGGWDSGGIEITVPPAP